MARMYPDPLRPDTRSNAERKLYAEFQSQLADDFVVFHSVWWQVRNTTGGVRDGEADFVLTHPNWGILLIEVKGGSIRYDGQTGEWFSNDKSIKDPFKQGREGKYSLLEKLKELPYWNRRWINVGYAVAFPDIAVKGDLRLDAPRELILDAWDMSDLVVWVERALHYLKGRRPDDSPLGVTGTTELIKVLGPSWELRPLLSTQIMNEKQELTRLTEEQFMLLGFLGQRRRVAICGCAGSGKTTLALEKARRLAEQEFRVLLTCFNVKLAEFLNGNAASLPNLNIVNFHRLATELSRQARLRHYGARDSQYFDEILPEQMMEAVDRLGTQYDAVIVDEGQDFRDNWWVPLQYLLHDPDNGIFYVFFDDNQNLYRTAQNVPLELAPFSLTRNCRNTQCIHKTVMSFYKSTQVPTVQGPPGRPVEIIDYRDANELKRTISKLLHRLVVEEGVPLADIVILTPKGRDRSALWRMAVFGNFELTENRPGGGGEVFCSTIHSFKGLESSIIILAEIDRYASIDLTTALYVGCSRACNHLIVLTSPNLAEDVRRKLTQK